MKQIILTFLTLLLGTAQAAAQTAFFQGKTIRIAVGYLSGDTHDLWARAYARNLGKHVFGKSRNHRPEHARCWVDDRRELCL